MENKTGGQAFPSLNAEFTGISSEGEERFDVEPSGGMTLRDYFAAKAMQAILSSPADHYFNPAETVVVKATAELSYDYADAMLKARIE